jgi:L-ornithine N5-oxygenase
MQRIKHGNTPAEECNWPHRIMPYRKVTSISDTPGGGLRLEIADSSPLYLSEKPGETERIETMDVDAVFVATGYHRDLHETLLKDARHLMPGGDLQDAKWTVSREYKVLFENKRVAEDAGVWLQGCCERTHGVSCHCLCDCEVAWTLTITQLSDTLLSVLATRGGDMVRSVFERPGKWGREDVLDAYEEKR